MRGKGVFLVFSLFPCYRTLCPTYTNTRTLSHALFLSPYLLTTVEFWKGINQYHKTETEPLMNYCHDRQTDSVNWLTHRQSDKWNEVWIMFLCTCSRILLIRSTSQSIRKRFSCRRSISSIMRRYSSGSTMLPTERAVTCQLFITADSMMACRMENPETENNTWCNTPLRRACVDVVPGQNWARMMEQVLFHFSLWFENTEELLMQCKSEGMKGGKAEKEAWWM